MFSISRDELGPNFTFGAATAAYQIEGGQTEGRGPSTWDTFAATPGNVKNRDDGAVATDHYNRWPGDLDLIRDGGFDAYRFSIAWPRLIPEGTGAINEAGLDFYDRLIDGMLERGLKPYATLYHWDLPSALMDKGGWMNRDIANWFADYAALVAQRYGDRLHATATINEPWCVAWLSTALAPYLPAGYERDIEVVSRPLDWLGINYYTRGLYKADPNGFLGHGKASGPLPKSDLGWEIYPEGLTDLLVRVSREYTKLPLYITETGMSETDDTRRVDFYDRHLRAVADAQGQGADVRGFFAWSLLDNYEWAEGYTSRFGIVHVDYETQVRTPKGSYRAFQGMLHNTK